jgi:glucokinase
MAGRRTAIGVDVGGTETKGGLVTPAGELLVRIENPTERESGTKGIIALAEALLDKAKEMDVEVTSIGIGAAGFIDAETGSVVFAPNLVYDDPAIGEAVRAAVDLPVTIDNDANAAAWGELHFGAGKGMKHLALLTIGTGIGSGFVVEGRLLHGATGAAAEFGHTIVAPDGPRCNCGLNGCLEAVASGIAIARMGREAVEEHPDSIILSFAASPEEVTARDVARAAKQYDEVARGILATAGRYLGIGLSNVVNVFDPQSIVLGGSVIQSGEPFLGPARDELARLTAAQRRRPMRLDATRLGQDAGLIGAAALALVEQPKAVSTRTDDELGPGVA